LVLRFLLREIKLPWNNTLSPLLLFFAFTIVTTAAGALLAPIPLHGQEYWGRALRAFLTFGIGLSFFVAAIWMNQTEDDLNHSLKWLYTGLFITIVWTAVQAISLHTPLLKKGQVSAWQELFSVRGLTKVRRVSGFAFEASWFAGQIVTLYLPWLFASLIARYRATKYKWLAPLLLIGAIASLLLTFSRGGMLIAVAATGVTVLVSGRRAIVRAFRWFFKGNREDTEQAKTSSKPQRLGGSRLAHYGTRALLLILIVAMVWGGVSFIAQQQYVTRLWTVEANSLSDYFVQINAGGRITYLWAAANVYAAHPFFGTGLGSAGFYLFQNYPDWAMYNNPEVARQLSPTTRLFPNAKNLYLRLLVETGIFGLTIFISFLFALLAEVGKAFQCNQKIVAIVGLYTWFAIAIYYFMQDSFAMAELWINFGIILGITYRTAKSPKTQRFP
jgi:O-antigen ligase